MSASMSGTLFVVATPIGNLEDITLRALRVLHEADIIAAEDTRRTSRLLAHHVITTKTISFHQHNTRSRVPQLIARLRAGASVALVTDAGTPGVSDPGLELVNACVAEGISVDPVPGASAPLAAAVAAGFSLTPFTFLGFPPTKSYDRTAWFGVASSVVGTFCFFESPHRIARTMREAAVAWGERPIVVARELTKVHQEFLRGSAHELSARLESPRGEFTVVVGPALNVEIPVTTETGGEFDARIRLEFGHLTERGGISRRAAIVQLAKQHRRSAKEIYSAVERGKK
jgi:16S rRNA (cytidine1402-2'-O)-methyltransferase